MLSTALKARLPIITVSSADNAMVVETLTDWAAAAKLMVKPLATGASATTIAMAKNTVFLKVGSTEDHTPLLSTLRAQENVLVLVNPEKAPLCAYHAGELLPTDRMLREFLAPHIGEATVGKWMPVFHDLTLFQVETLIRMAGARYGKLNLKNTLSTRVELFGHVGGLVQESTVEQFYMPDSKIVEWVNLNAPVMTMAGIHSDLIPRGLLFDGPPGTGKTAGARWIADKLGLPLLRLETGTFLGKYVGESESNMLRLLRVLDREAPCVFLMDEVEKLFTIGNDDAGVTSRLMGQLLWWLQEHDSRVLTIMTTNNRKALPPELFREGRIDAVMDFGYMDTQSAKKLLFSYMKVLGHDNLAPAVFETVRLIPEPTPVKVMAAARGAIKAKLKESQK